MNVEFYKAINSLLKDAAMIDILYGYPLKIEIDEEEMARRAEKMRGFHSEGLSRLAYPESE